MGTDAILETERIDDQPDSMFGRNHDHNGNPIHYDFSGYRLQVGDGVVRNNGSGGNGIIRAINRSNNTAQVEWLMVRQTGIECQPNKTIPTGELEWIKLSKLDFMPTPDQIAAKREEIQRGWSPARERMANQYPVKPIEVQPHELKGHTANGTPIYRKGISGSGEVNSHI